jgi:hypothetical protein
VKEAEWRLHPLIHTLLGFTLVQHVVSRQSEAPEKYEPLPPTQWRYRVLSQCDEDRLNCQTD